MVDRENEEKLFHYYQRKPPLNFHFGSKFKIMNLFVLVLAKDFTHVKAKFEELTKLKIPFLVVCGEKTGCPNTYYRQPKGKFDAINVGLHLIPKEYDVIALNDVDTEIVNFEKAAEKLQQGIADVVFADVRVKRGPQVFFYRLLNAIRRRLIIAASGELMLLRRSFIEPQIPLKPCKAEDSYIVFKALSLKQRVCFSEDCYVVTERTKNARMEEKYKRRTTCGIYQAISLAHPPMLIRFFYYLLPFISPLLIVLGQNGYFWMKGIMLGLNDYLRKDRSGTWSNTYLSEK